MITKIVPRGGGYTITTDDERVFDVEIVLLNGQLVLVPTLPADILAELNAITLGSGLSALSGSETDPVYLAEKGQPNGAATLDGTGNVPLSQLGNAPSGASFPLLAPDGSSAAPSYSFSGATSTGMFIYSGPTLTLVRAGVDAMYVDVSGGVTTVQFPNDGDETNPALEFGSNLAAGLYSNAGGDLGFSTGGNTTLFLNQAAQQLQARDGANSEPSYAFLNAADTGMWWDGSGIAFSAGTQVAAIRNAPEVIVGFNDLNAQVVISVENINSGNEALAAFEAKVPTGTSWFGRTGSAWSGSFGIAADETFVLAQNPSNGLALVCEGPDPIRFVPNSIEEFRILSGDSVFRSIHSHAANPADVVTNEQANWFIFDDGVTREVRWRYRDTGGTVRSGAVNLI